MEKLTFWQFFSEPFLRAPTLGAMLMCLTSSLIGVIIFVNRRCLLGEALSHATYPGVIVGVLLSPFFCPSSSLFSSLFILCGAFVSSWFGLYLIGKLEKTWRIHSDAALCLVLSLFLGFGVTLASRLQFIFPIWYQQGQIFLFGQAATMGDHHVFIYAFLALCLLVFIILSFRQIELIYFDREYAMSLGIRGKGCEHLTSLFLILAIVIGIRSVGVILMSGMLIAPTAFARQMTDQLRKMFFFSGLIGMISGFLGVYLSVQIPLLIDPTDPVSLPTGPVILLVATSLTFFALLFSPKGGWVARKIRIRQFKMQCLSDHLLKILWKEKGLSLKALKGKLSLSRFRLFYLLFLSRKGGWIEGKQEINLTRDGKRKGSRIVRLHRLWELYLTSEMKVDENRVHCSAEEMEHILTPAIEERLTKLLKDPKKDPHKQPIPERGKI